MPPIVNNPESLTVQQLKAELRRKKIPFPNGNLRKNVYVQLYRKHILKDRRSGTGFSSDEDEQIPKPTPRSSTYRNVARRTQIQQTYTQNTPSARKGAYKIIFQDKLSDVEDMTDRKLRTELEKRGVTVGPIVASTRQVYERKLADLLVKEVEKGEPLRDSFRTRSTMVSFNDDDDEEEDDDYEEEDEEEEEEEEEAEEEEEEDKFSDSDLDDQRVSGRGDSRLQKRTSRVETQSFFTSSTKKSSQRTHRSAKPQSTRYYCGLPLWLWWLLVLAGIVGFIYMVWVNMEQTPSVGNKELTEED